MIINTNTAKDSPNPDISENRHIQVPGLALGMWVTARMTTVQAVRSVRLTDMSLASGLRFPSETPGELLELSNLELPNLGNPQQAAKAPERNQV